MNAQTVLPRAAAKDLVVAAATVLLAAPLAAHASVDAATDACIEAFVAANVPKEHQVIVQKRKAAASAFSSQSKMLKVTLTARGMRSGRQFAEGTCIADRNGQVFSIHAKRPPAQQQVAQARTEKTPAR